MKKGKNLTHKLGITSVGFIHFTGKLNLLSSAKIQAVYIFSHQNQDFLNKEKTKYEQIKKNIERKYKNKIIIILDIYN